MGRKRDQLQTKPKRGPGKAARRQQDPGDISAVKKGNLKNF